MPGHVILPQLVRATTRLMPMIIHGDSLEIYRVLHLCNASLLMTLTWHYHHEHTTNAIGVHST